MLQPKIKQDFRKAENFLQERGGRKTDDQKTDNLSRQKQQKQWKKDRRVRLTDVTRGGVYNEILSRFEAPPQMKTDTQSQMQTQIRKSHLLWDNVFKIISTFAEGMGVIIKSDETRRTSNNGYTLFYQNGWLGHSPLTRMYYHALILTSTHHLVGMR